MIVNKLYNKSKVSPNAKFIDVYIKREAPHINGKHLFDLP